MTKHRAPMERMTRLPLERMAVIHRALLEGWNFTAGKMSGVLQVCPKTVRRDMDFMRDRLNLPLAYDARKGHWRYQGRPPQDLFRVAVKVRRK